MSAATDVIVTLDDRLRLMAAALAATHFPETRKPHGTHPHARATRKHLAAFADHPAVQTLQALLDQGAPLEAIFTLALILRFPEGRIDKPPRWMPPDWDDQLCAFYDDANLGAWWQAEDAGWEKALGDAQRMFAPVQFKAFLEPFVGSIHERLIFLPNISYPTDTDLGLRIANDLVCIAPPRLAWGDSAPWPFDEDPAYIYRVALSQYGSLLMNAYLRAHAETITELAQKTPLPVTDQYKALFPTWAEQFVNLFVGGIVAIYLEDHVSAAEANAYVLMERKVRGLEILPGVINVFRYYLKERDAGHFTSLIDLLPNFSKRLRIANRIVTL